MTDSENTQLALLAQKVDALTWQVEKLLNDHEERLRVLEISITQLKERMTVWQIVQSAYSTVVGIVAGAFGRQ